jgi:U3 small nucleolar RNA-associated protein 25
VDILLLYQYILCLFNIYIVYLLQANVAFLSEYSTESDIGRSRATFYQGIRDILIYSGRAHFFRRFRIRGARHVVFYSLPEYPHFYSEIVNMISTDDQPSSSSSSTLIGGDTSRDEKQAHNLMQEISCLTLFTEYERMALERIVGYKKTEVMLSSEKNTFVFF